MRMKMKYHFLYLFFSLILFPTDEKGIFSVKRFSRLLSLLCGVLD